MLRHVWASLRKFLPIMSGKQPPGFSFTIQFMKKRSFCQELHDAPLEAKESMEGKRTLNPIIALA